MNYMILLHIDADVNIDISLTDIVSNHPEPCKANADIESTVLSYLRHENYIFLKEC